MRVALGSVIEAAAMTELIAASEELTRRMDENGHYAGPTVGTAWP